MKKPQLIIEISGGLVSSITTNLKQLEIDVYVIDWDNIKAGDKITDEVWLFEKTEAEIDGILNNWIKKQESQ